MSIDKKHVELQFRRLERHYRVCLKGIDAISLLDLANTLRIWVDMKKDIDELLQEQCFSPEFPNPTKNKKLMKLLKGTPFTAIPLTSAPKTAGIKVRNIILIGKKLTKEEMRKLSISQSHARSRTRLNFSQWLGSEIFEMNRGAGGDRIGISRETIIKRVANILGGSHPWHTGSRKRENKCDYIVRELHQTVVAGGYPLAHYILLDIAEDMVKCLKGLFSRTN